MEEIRDTDILDPVTYETAVPFAAFAELRARSPVVALEDPDGGRLWGVLGHAEVVEVSRDPETFSSARRGTQIADPTPEQLPLVQTMMLNLDPPPHRSFRNVVRVGFTPARVAALEARVRGFARDILARVGEMGTFDFVREVAAELPLLVIAELLGVPVEDRALLFGWSNRTVGFDDPEYATSSDDALAAGTEMYMYAHGLAAERRKAPHDDLISVLMHAEVDGRRITEEEFNGLFVQIAVAGNETTRSLISGGLLALLEHPVEAARLRAEPSLLPSAVEEMLRWVTPVLLFRRTATRDCQLGDVRVEAGDKVVLFYAAANRDERVFAVPDHFDAAREPNPHVAFGVGEHFCIGAALARMEARVLFEELHERLPGLELAGSVRRLRSNQINGIKEMPVTIRTWRA